MQNTQIVQIQIGKWESNSTASLINPLGVIWGKHFPSEFKIQVPCTKRMDEHGWYHGIADYDSDTMSMVLFSEQLLLSEFANYFSAVSSSFTNT